MLAVQTIQTKFGTIITWLKQSPIQLKVILLLVIAALVWFSRSLFIKTNQQPQYQTTQVEKGTLIESVTVSGAVNNANGINVSTKATGVVSEVYVNNGEYVEEGTPIATLTLDQAGQQQQSQSYASYLSAKNNLDSAQANAYSLQADMFSKWETFKQLAESSDYTNSDGTPVHRDLPEFNIPEKDWLAAEAKYKNQQAVITQTQIALNAAWLSYQQSSNTIVAPMSGTVSDLTIQPGSIITSGSSNSESNINTPQKIAMVKTQALPSVTVNLTEIDVPKVQIGDKATLTFDAFPDKTFTGRVAAIDTQGTVSSGVTMYPTTIVLDTATQTIYPNMSASASIITNTKTNVLIVPSAAIQTVNGESTVRIMKNNSVETVTVETGIFNDTQTEVISGLSEGETIITGQTFTGTQNRSSAAGQTTTSPFGSTGRGGFFGGGGGNVRIIR